METPFFIEYCPHPVTVYSRGPIKDYVHPYYIYYPTVTEGGAVPKVYSKHVAGRRSAERQCQSNRYLAPGDDTYLRSALGLRV